MIKRVFIAGHNGMVWLVLINGFFKNQDNLRGQLLLGLKKC